jgi:hypothetical protein
VIAYRKAFMEIKMVGKIFCFEKLNRKHIKYLPSGGAGI